MLVPLEKLEPLEKRVLPVKLEKQVPLVKPVRQAIQVTQAAQERQVTLVKLDIQVIQVALVPQELPREFSLDRGPLQRISETLEISILI
jgi:hypothetical protein